MPKSLRQQVRDRSDGCCEYCCLPQEFDVRPFQLDHIRSRKLRGPTLLTNLAWACLNCNSYKQALPAGHDPETDELTPLFNPRMDSWEEHFDWDGPTLKGKSAIARTTIDVLRINLAEHVEHRRLLIKAGLFPRSPRAQ